MLIVSSKKQSIKSTRGCLLAASGFPHLKLTSSFSENANHQFPLPLSAFLAYTSTLDTPGPCTSKLSKRKCLRTLNILKILSHPRSGCTHRTLLSLYQSLIRPIIDFGSPIYGLASPSHLKLLDPIQNSAIRFAIGAFRTSSALNLYDEAGIPPHFISDA